MLNPFIPAIQSYLPEPEASLLAGMLFGGTNGFSAKFYEALLATGTIHVVALSGTNITILINLISKFTFPLGRKLSSLFSIAAIVAFIFFVGPSPTVVRAGIMGSLTLLSVYFGRQKYSLLSLMLASFLMIIFDKSILTNISFQLSFLSTLGIIIFASTPVSFKNRGRNILWDIFNDIKTVFWENLKTTLSAQVATLPLIVFAFGRISLIAPLSNVLVGWVVNPIMVLGTLICLVSVISNSLGQLLAFFAYLPLHYFVKVVELSGSLPFASLILK